MDQSESVAYRYLLSLDDGPVIFEPDGNVPPDFTVGACAVEVRRLNQNFEHANGTFEGLECLEISLMQRLYKHLPSLGPFHPNEHWWVMIEFKRPITHLANVVAEIVNALTQFATQPIRTPCKVHVSRNCSLDLYRARDHGSFFRFGGGCDMDAGGFVLGELDRNLRHCLKAKEALIEPYRAKYKHWWLVLVDHIDWSMEEHERNQFREHILPHLQHRFDRIVLLDPREIRTPFLMQQ